MPQALSAKRGSIPFTSSKLLSVSERSYFLCFLAEIIISYKVKWAVDNRPYRQKQKYWATIGRPQIMNKIFCVLRVFLRIVFSDYLGKRAVFNAVAVEDYLFNRAVARCGVHCRKQNSLPN